MHLNACLLQDGTRLEVKIHMEAFKYIQKNNILGIFHSILGVFHTYIAVSLN